MPNKYITRPMTLAEFLVAKRASGLADGELQKITGRHRFDIVRLMDGEQEPRHIEAVVLDYLARHPERRTDMLDAAEDRIEGHSKDEGRAARRAHLQRNGEDSA